MTNNIQPNEYSPIEVWDDWMDQVPLELQDEDGIAAQFAAAAAIMIFLKIRGGDWYFEPTPVGGWADRISVDGFLINGTTSQLFAIDFSLEDADSPRGNKRDNQYLVHLRRHWFEIDKYDIWQLKPRFLNELCKAFLPALSQKPFPLVRPPKK